MSVLRALIVDDEPHVRDELAFALQSSGGDVRVQQCSTAIEALALLQDEPFDIVFLDVRMPGLSGLEAMRVIEKLPQRPQVAFVTAHEDHAIEAFEHEAVDYLLKPVSPDRLSKTLARVQARKPPSGAAAIPARFPVDLDGRTMLIAPSEIRYATATGHDVTVHTFESAFRYKGTLTECASRLRGLLRVHRAYLVNPQHVVEVRPFFAGTYTLVTDDKARSEVPVSRAFAKTVRSAFHL
jgi:two-component system, LytTR family, response regulator LytT